MCSHYLLTIKFVTRLSDLAMKAIITPYNTNNIKNQCAVEKLIKIMKYYPFLSFHLKNPIFVHSFYIQSRTVDDVSLNLQGYNQ